MSNYIAHLASDADERLTACGEPWQGWQEPFDADRAVLSGRSRIDPPMHYDPPQPHRDAIRQCQACMRMSTALSWPPDEDTSYVDHGRELWDERTARAEQEDEDGE